MSTKYTTVADIIDALPGGFAADWSVDFRSAAGETVVTDGPDWADGIPDGEEWDSAREDAREYSERVADAIEQALEYEGQCREAMEDGRYDDAREALAEAMRQEGQFGDSPSYYSAERAMNALAVFGVYFIEDGCDEAFAGEFETLADAQAHAETSPPYLYRSEYGTARAAGALGPHTLTAPDYTGCGEAISYHGDYGVVVCPVFAECDDY